jgi:spore maturation protein CgeB
MKPARPHAVQRRGPSDMNPTRLLLVDTTLHQAPWPIFLDAVTEVSQTKPSDFAFSFLDEARFSVLPNIKVRALTRALDYITLKTHDPAKRRRIVKLAVRLFRYRRHPVDGDALNKALMATARSFHPDVVIVVMGFHIRAAVLAELKQQSGAAIINYATDDPFNSRLSNPDLIDSIPSYDVYACTKKGIMDDVRQAGSPCASYVPFGYNPLLHFPEQPATSEEVRRFASDVAFIGEADADRVPFFRKLIRAIPELDLALYGGLWDRDSVTRRYARGSARGRDFRLALGGTRIAVNLIRRGNRDDHVMRTFEAPACGAFVLNERTPEHLALLAEDREAAYFSSPTEMVEKIRYYLLRDIERDRIAQAGHRRIAKGRNTYKDRLFQLLGLCSISDSRPRNVVIPMRANRAVAGS